MEDKVGFDTRSKEYDDNPLEAYTSPTAVNRLSVPFGNSNHPFGSSSRNIQPMPFEKNMSLKISHGVSTQSLLQPSGRRVETQGDEEEVSYNRYSYLGPSHNYKN